jgi:hypothetical protein
VLRDCAAIADAANGTSLSTDDETAGELGVTARMVVDAVLAHLGMDAWDFDTRPKAKRNSFARRLMTWIWVHHLDGRQIALVRELKVSTHSVSRWYSVAASTAPDLDDAATAVVGALRRISRPGHSQRPARAVVQVTVED